MSNYYETTYSYANNFGGLLDPIALLNQLLALDGSISSTCTGIVGPDPNSDDILIYWNTTLSGTDKAIVNSAINSYVYVMPPTAVPDLDNVISTYTTATIPLVAANAFQTITTTTDTIKLNWPHTPGTPAFTIPATGTYSIFYKANVSKTSSGVQTASFSVQRSSGGTYSEIETSQHGFDIGTSAQVMATSKDFFCSLNQGDIIKFLFGGTSTPMTVVPAGMGTYKTSFSVAMQRIA